MLLNILNKYPFLFGICGFVGLDYSLYVPKKAFLVTVWTNMDGFKNVFLGIIGVSLQEYVITD